MSYERKRAPDQPAANDPQYVVIELRARIAALEAIVGKQEEELHQGELRVAELEAKNEQWKDLYMKAVEGNHPTEHYYQMTAHLREKYRAELAALKCCGNCKWFRAEEYQYCGLPDIPGYKTADHEYYISAPDECDFTPSRWTNS